MAAVQPTRLGHPRFLDAVGAQPADFNEVRSPKNPAVLGLMRLNFLSVQGVDFEVLGELFLCQANGPTAVSDVAPKRLASDRRMGFAMRCCPCK